MKVFPASLPLLAVASLAVLVLLLPALAIVLSWLGPRPEIWRHLLDYRLAELLQNTLFMVTGVGLTVGLLGFSLAWINVACEYPGRRWLEWLLVLPLAMPVYVLAFAFLGVFGIGGSVQSFLAEWLGAGFVQADIRSPFTVVLVLSLALYPYVYILTRTAFLMQGVELMEAARILGHRPFSALLRVVLPAARPALAAGIALALMESLADFGAVSVFNYNTFTTAIYETWFGMFDPVAAAQLASLLFLLALLAPLGERLLRGRAQYSQAHPSAAHRQTLHGMSAALACAFCAGIFALGFLLPFVQILFWCWEALPGLNPRLVELLLNSLSLALLVTACVAPLALLLSCLRHWHPSWQTRLYFQFAASGYALPGTVLAAGVVVAATVALQFLPSAAWADGLRSVLLPGGIGLLALACTVRFTAPALGALESGFERIQPVFTEAARNLGAGQMRILWRIHLPLLLPAIGSAVLLVFVEAMREMPATLLLRPFGWDTLAVRIFEMSSEGEWEQAALPSLFLVLLGLLPVALILRQPLLYYRPHPQV